MQNTDSFIVGARKAVKAQKVQKAKFDELGNITQLELPALPPEPARKGHRVTIKTPIPFHVILKAVEYWGEDIAGTIRAGEVIVKSCVVKDDEWEIVEADGTLMMSLCTTVAGVYLTPEQVEQVKKNSQPPPTSTE